MPQKIDAALLHELIIEVEKAEVFQLHGDAYEHGSRFVKPSGQKVIIEGLRLLIAKLQQ